MPQPLQRPHPPIVVTAVAPFSKGVTEAAARGWDPISANFLMPHWVKSHWPKYVEGCERGGRAGRSGKLARGQEHVRRRGRARPRRPTPPIRTGPIVYYYRSLFTKLKKNGRIELFKTRRDQPDDEVTLEAICDKLIIYGTPDKRRGSSCWLSSDEVGDFGTLLYAGKDWKDRELGTPLDDADGREGDAARERRHFGPLQRRGIVRQFI